MAPIFKRLESLRRKLRYVDDSWSGGVVAASSARRLRRRRPNDAVDQRREAPTPSEHEDVMSDTDPASFAAVLNHRPCPAHRPMRSAPGSAGDQWQVVLGAGFCEARAL